jgi:hypothetical protein
LRFGPRGRDTYSACEALGVSRGGLYAWLTRPRSQRSRSDEELGVKGLPQVLAQNTSASTAANTTYALNVCAGARNDFADPWIASPPFQPTIELLANGTVVASLVLTDPGRANGGTTRCPGTAALHHPMSDRRRGLRLCYPRALPAIPQPCRSYGMTSR